MAKKKKANKVQAETSGGIQSRYQLVREFLEQAKAELKKVTWPSRKETLTTSVAVIVLVVIISLFLGLADFSLTKLIKLVLS